MIDWALCVCSNSEKRVGNIYSKASSFVDYIRRALRKLELEESKVSPSHAGNVFAMVQIPIIYYYY